MTRRADRLFDLIEVLRAASAPLTAAAVAAELETSRRTVYRDVATLMARRVPIRGEAGVGYVLDDGFDLPPLMLTADEVEAAVLGARWVAAHADPALARAAAGLLAKVAAVIPEPLRGTIDDPAVGTPPALGERLDGAIDVARLRAWSRQGRKVALRYLDGGGRASARTVWPFLVGYRDGTRMVPAWCELRRDFRLFRTDRLRGVDFLDERYPEGRGTLRRRWLAAEDARRAEAKPAATRAGG